jgi:phospholipid/cholesterol/gamma-HCH transport system substrate-binding protein
MKTSTTKQDIKLGLFVFIGICLFLAAVFVIGKDNNMFSRKMYAFVVFHNVEGLKVGDNVWLSGVKIGIVKDVKIVSAGKVIIRVQIKDEHSEFIKTDAVATIGSDGLVGNKILVINPGVAPYSLQSNDTISSKLQTDTQALFDIAKDVGTNARSITDDLSKIIKSVQEGNGIVGELMRDGAFAVELRDVASNLKASSNQTLAVTKELNEFMHALNTNESLLNRLATDTAYANTVDRTLKSLQTSATQVQNATEGLNTFVGKVNDQSNMLNVLVSNAEAANSLKHTLESAQSASAKLDENMEAMQHNFLLRRYFKKKNKNKL